MFEVQGTLHRLPGATRIGFAMYLLLVLSPWRRRGELDATAALQVVVPMDLDEADAWLQHLDPGDAVTVVCESLVAPTPPARDWIAIGVRITAVD